MNKTSTQLRRNFDKRDSFFSGSQPIKIRRPRRVIPSWVFSNEKIKNFLKGSFPKLSSDAKQRDRAGRWARVIQLYFRANKSYRETAEEMGEKPRTVEMIIRTIHRVSKGMPSDGRKRKKVHAVVQINLGEVDKSPQGNP